MDETRNTLRTDSTFCLNTDQNRFSRFRVNLDATYVKVREYSQRPLPMPFSKTRDPKSTDRKMLEFHKFRRETIFWKN